MTFLRGSPLYLALLLVAIYVPIVYRDTWWAGWVFGIGVVGLWALTPTWGTPPKRRQGELR